MNDDYVIIIIILFYIYIILLYYTTILSLAFLKFEMIKDLGSQQLIKTGELAQC